MIRTVGVVLRIFVLLMIAVAAIPLSAQVILYYETDPPVIPADRVSPVMLRAKLNFMALCPPFCGSSYPRLVLQTTPAITLYDDGTNGDAVALDGLFSAWIPAGTLITGLRSDDVLRRFVGYLDVFDGTTRVLRVNVFAQIADATLPQYPVTVLAPDVQYTPHIVNIVDPFFLDYGQDLGSVARRVYAFFPDSFQFLNLVNSRNYVQNRFYGQLRNSVQGIGLPLLDSGASFGSAANLLGVAVFPSAVFFDGASKGYVHELGHQWINFVDLDVLASGSPHWPPSTLAIGVMGMNIPGSSEGGTFPCQLVPEGTTVRLVRAASTNEFTDLDLYLMGLVPPDAVGEHIVLINPPSNIDSQCDGRLYSGEIRRVNIADVITADGPRVPDHTQTRRSLAIGTVIISPAPLDSLTMSYFSYFAARAELTTAVLAHEGLSKYVSKPLAVATGGRLSVDTTMSPSSNTDSDVRHRPSITPRRPTHNDSPGGTSRGITRKNSDRTTQRSVQR